MGVLVCTFDLEPWWAVVPPIVSRESWSDLPDRSEQPLNRFLELCAQTSSTATFFVVAEYARRYPERIRPIVDAGHEIGCHSLFHDDLALQGERQFYEETRTAKEIIEQAAGVSVDAFRAPSFSVPAPWLRRFFGTLEELGFRTDSSLSTATRVHGGSRYLGSVGEVFSLRELTGTDLVEVGVPGVPLLGREIALLGGGYLRITPTAIARAALRKSPYQVLYLHPHDFDIACPKIPGVGQLAHFRRQLRFGDLAERVYALLRDRPGLSCRIIADRFRAESDLGS